MDDKKIHNKKYFMYLNIGLLLEEVINLRAHLKLSNQSLFLNY